MIYISEVVLDDSGIVTEFLVDEEGNYAGRNRYMYEGEFRNQPGPLIPDEIGVVKRAINWITGGSE